MLHPHSYHALQNTAEDISYALDTIRFESGFVEEGGNYLALLHEHQSFCFEGGRDI